VHALFHVLAGELRIGADIVHDFGVAVSLVTLVYAVHVSVTTPADLDTLHTLVALEFIMFVTLLVYWNQTTHERR
jgi:hypothetical protein